MGVKDEIVAFEELARQFGGNAALAREILAECSVELPGRIGAIRAAVRRGDSPGVAGLVHALKGMAANLRLPALRAATETLERAASEGNGAAVRDALLRLHAEADRVRAAVAEVAG